MMRLPKIMEQETTAIPPESSPGPQSAMAKSSSSPSSSGMKKSVRIDESFNRYKRIYHINDLSLEQRNRIWLCAEDFMRTKKEYTAIVRMMMKATGPIEETDELCCRGLEFKTKNGSRHRKRNKQKAVLAVLDEQDIQRDEGICDPEFICDLYKEVTGPSSLEALNRGLKDQKVMMELLEPEIRDRQLLLPSTGKAINTGKKSTSDLPIMPRRRSVTETLNNGDMQTLHLLVTPR